MADADISRVVLITGCSSGIGEACARRLLAHGWRVYATARDVESLTSLREAGCRVLALDVTSDASMQAAVQAITQEAGGIGALVNNAGYSQSGPIEAVSIERIRRQFETNVFGLIRLTQLVLPGMRARRQGRIVNMGSMGGRLTFPAGGIYHATKHALEAITDALRFEVSGFGLHVVLIQPGLIRTHFTRTVSTHLDALGQTAGPYAHFTSEVDRITRESYERGRLAPLVGSAEDVAAVVEEALSARSPRTRYRVAASAHLLLLFKRLVTDRMWDGFLARTYPRPGARP
ncbi:MAG TPA: SDR family NAD(P)-dependent oxidoreductase [Luteitalea sp.]|nr:SDR family NAD(P)-dependent oxidoreductase [Luteitalea sp.]